MMKDILSLGWLSIVGVFMAGCASGLSSSNSADHELVELTLHDVAVPVIAEFSETQCRSNVTRDKSENREVVCLKAPKQMSAESFDESALRQIELIDKALGVKRDELNGWAGWSIRCGRMFFLALVPEDREEFEPDFTNIPEGVEFAEMLEMIDQQRGNPDIAFEYDREFWCDPSQQDGDFIQLTNRVSIQAPTRSKVIPDCRLFLDRELRHGLSGDWKEADVFACIRIKEGLGELFKNVATQIENQGLNGYTDDYYGVLRYRDNCARISLSAFPPMNELPWRSPSVAIESISDFYCSGPSE